MLITLLRLCIALCALGMAPLMQPVQRGEQPPAAMPAGAGVLTRGVNLSHWFWMAEDESAAGVSAFFGVADAEQLKRLGVTVVRLPVEPDYLWDTSTHALRQANLASYRTGMELFTGRGIGVVVDPHPTETEWASPREPAFAEEYARFWSALGAALKDTDPKLVLLEIMNEPHDLADKGAWPRLQEGLARAIRAAAPGHTMIATGDEWGSIDGLVRLKPLADANVVYSFHFYEPHTFTHQGAGWGSPKWKGLRQVPYPASEELVRGALEATKDEQGKREIEWYGKQGWNREKVRARLKTAADWGAEHGVRVWCGEFGAYREKTPPEPRAAWLRDVTGCLRELGVGWCMWDYAGGFALVEGEPGKRSVHRDTAEAVGLRTGN